MAYDITWPDVLAGDTDSVRAAGAQYRNRFEGLDALADAKEAATP